MSCLGKAVADFKLLREAADYARRRLAARSVDPDLTVSRRHLEVLLVAADGLVEDAKLALEETK